MSAPPRRLRSVAPVVASAVLLVLGAACASSGGGEREARPRSAGLLTVAELRARNQPVDSASRVSARESVSRVDGGTGTLTDTIPLAPPVAEPMRRVEPVQSASLVPRDAPPARSVAYDRRRAPAMQQGRWIQVTSVQPVIPLMLDSEPVGDVIAGLAEATGYNIVLSNEPAVRNTLLTASISNLPWHLALEAVLEAHGLRAIQLPSGVIKIVTQSAASRDRTMEPLELRYLTASDVQRALAQMLATQGDSLANVQFIGDPATSRRLVVNGSAEEIASVRSLIARLDRRPPNVTVEARIVQVNRDRMRKVGVSYAFGRVREDSTGRLIPTIDVRQTTTPQGGITSSNGPALELVRSLGGFGNVNLNVFVDAVTGRGFAETQSTPMITTLSDISAFIRVGDAFVLPNQQPLYGGIPVLGGQQPGAFPGQQPGFPGQQPGGQPQGPGGYGDLQGGLQPGGITPNFGATAGGFTRFETGTTLRVTPYVLGNGMIRVKIDLERDGGTLSPDGRSLSGGNQVAFSDVIVQEGTPIAIGGLTVSARSEGRSGVPLFSSLPLIGSLFGTSEDASKYSDLLIIITPRIESEDTPYVASIGGN